jgi:hypothetical protein
MMQIARVYKALYSSLPLGEIPLAGREGFGVFPSLAKAISPRGREENSTTKEITV